MCTLCHFFVQICIYLLSFITYYIFILFKIYTIFSFIDLLSDKTYKQRLILFENISN